MNNTALTSIGLASIIFISSAMGDEEIVSEHDISLISQAEKNDRVIIHGLKGVLLVPSRDTNTSPEMNEVGGFQAVGFDVPGGVEKINTELGPRFIDQSLTQNDMLELKRAVILYYRDQGFPIVSVEIPPQKVNNDVLKLVVIEGKMGSIHVKGNRYFSDASFESQIRQSQGESINANILLNDVAWINRNPFYHVDTLFTPGVGERETDVELIVQDRLPFRPYVGVDNTGVDVTDEIRLWAGFNSRGISSGDVLTYQFTTAPKYDKFWAHTVHYLAPLPWRHTLIVFGGYSHVHPDITDFRSSGHSAQGSLRYDIPFNPIYKSFYHDLSLGFDLKNIHNDLEFFSEEQILAFTVIAKAPVVTKVVNLTQLYAGYKLSQAWEKNKLEFRVEMNWSPGKWLANQENSNFSELHPGALNHYIYSFVTLKDTWELPYKFSFNSSFRGQISNENLIPSEQVGLGGYDTVRGYDEREVNYDDAICVNLEFYLPSFRVLRFLHKHPDELSFLGFFDYGTGRNVHAGGEVQWQKLISAGPGVRYKISDYLTARLDWGFRLHKIEFTGLGNKLHFGVMASY